MDFRYDTTASLSVLISVFNVNNVSSSFSSSDLSVATILSCFFLKSKYYIISKYKNSRQPYFIEIDFNSVDNSKLL